MVQALLILAIWLCPLAALGGDAQAHLERGDSLYGFSNDYAGAIAEYKKAIKANPNFDDAYVHMAVPLIVLKRCGEAAAALRKAIRINPNSAEGHVKLGLVYEKQGRYRDSIREYQTTLKINPDHYDAQDWLERVRAKLKR